MPPPSTVVTKLKVALKLSISRLRMVQQKEAAIAKMNRRTMAQLLEQGREESAKIRVENIIREDINVELLEILELYCELLLARIGLMDQKDCDPGLEEAVKSLIYAAPRTEIKELHQVRQLLVEKFGKDFAVNAIDNKDGKVAERVLSKLRIEPPKPELVELYLIEIARAYNVHYGPAEQYEKEEEEVDEIEGEEVVDDDDDDDDEPGSGGKLLEEPLENQKLSQATPPRKAPNAGPKSPIAVAPPSPTTENPSPHVKLPQPPELKGIPAKKVKAPPKVAPSAKPSAKASSKAGGGGGASKSADPDFDELSRRFQALKKLP